MSFLYGSYLTLTNLGKTDQRIEEQRLSPLFVSVHTTDQLRSRLLVNPRAAQVMNQLAWFDQRDLQIHAQVVVCPGLDEVLWRSSWAASGGAVWRWCRWGSPGRGRLTMAWFLWIRPAPAG